GTDYLREEWEKQWPDTHFYLAHRRIHENKVQPGEEVRFKKAQGYEVLAEDSQIVGHPDFVLMGIPEEAYQEYLRRKRERSEAGLLAPNPDEMEQELNTDKTSLKDAMTGFD